METIYVIVKNTRYDDINTNDVIEAFYNHTDAVQKFNEIKTQVKTELKEDKYENCDPLATSIEDYNSEFEFELYDWTSDYYENVKIVEAKLS